MTHPDSPANALAALMYVVGYLYGTSPKNGHVLYWQTTSLGARVGRASGWALYYFCLFTLADYFFHR